jgi:hypothetical protein
VPPAKEVVTGDQIGSTPASNPLLMHACPGQAASHTHTHRRRVGRGKHALTHSCPAHIHRWPPSIAAWLLASPHQHQASASAPATHPPPLLSTHTHTLHTHTGARPPCEYMRRGHRIAAAAAADAASTRFLVLCCLLAAVASTSSGEYMSLDLSRFLLLIL